MSWSLFSSGQTPKSWADAVLKGLGAPTTAANEQSLIAWAIQEGAGGTYNPLNTTLSADGATGSINSAGVKNYPSWSDGVSATVTTLQGGDYATIVSDLKSGNGIGQNASGALSTWGTGSWEVSIGDHWSQAASYLSGKSSPLPGGGGSNPPPASGGGSGGILSIPGDIITSFDDAAKFVTTLEWILVPSHWVRIAAFVIGGGLLVMAMVALVKVAEGESPGPSMPTIVPVPV